MLSAEEKKLQGTYRANRDPANGLKMKGEVVLDIEPPAKLIIHPALLESWKTTVPYLCKLGIVYRQDIHLLYMAYDLLVEIEYIDEKLSVLKEGKGWRKNYGKISGFVKLKLKCTAQYMDIMRAFFASPKERLKALSIFKQQKAKGKTPIDDFIGE